MHGGLGKGLLSIKNGGLRPRFFAQKAAKFFFSDRGSEIFVGLASAENRKICRLHSIEGLLLAIGLCLDWLVFTGRVEYKAGVYAPLFCSICRRDLLFASSENRIICCFSRRLKVCNRRTFVLRFLKFERSYFRRTLCAVTHGRAPDDGVLSQFLREPQYVRAEVWTALPSG